MIQLRDYQAKVVDDLYISIRKGNKSIMVVAPTGAGKTVLISKIIEGASKKGNAVLLQAHRAELVEQLSLTLAKYEIEHQLITSSSSLSQTKMSQYKQFGKISINPFSNVYIGSVQTLNRRLDKLPKDIKIIITDEAHHFSLDNQWDKVRKNYPNALSIGFSATPKRTDGAPLSDCFDDMVLGPEMADLIEAGFLSQYKLFTVPNMLDASGVKKKRNGEYDEKALEDLVNSKPSLTGDMVETYIKNCMGEQTVFYCVSRAHAKEVTAQLNANNVIAIYVDGEMHTEERRKALQRFAKKEAQVIVNVAIFSEGNDIEAISGIKGAQIDNVFDGSPSTSTIVIKQRWGRCLRPRAGKIAKIYDFSGNVFRVGLPCQRMNDVWTLDGEEKSKGKSKEKTISVRTCKKCSHVMEDKYTECVNCGYVFPIKERVIEQHEGELVELSKEDKERIKYEMKWQKKREQSRAESLEELIELGKSRGYKSPKAWALRIHHAREQKKVS